MPVTEVILDPECICRPFKPAMREQFLQMNPHHISCLYKPVFADNAVKQLIAYDDSLAGMLTFHVPEDSQKHCSDSAISSEAQDADPCSKMEDMVKTFSKLIKSEDHAAWNVTQNKHQMTFMEGLRLDKPKHGKDISPWATCKNCGYEETSKALIKTLTSQCKPRGRRLSAYHSNSAPITKTKHSRGGSASTVRNTQSTDSAKHETKLRHTDSFQKAANKTNTAGNTAAGFKKKPIGYKFKHSMKTSDYMNNYREVYTRAAMCLREDNNFSDMGPATAAMGASLSHDDLKNIPYSRAMCKDVREILKPTSPGGINKSIKMSQFSFDIAKGTQLRTKPAVRSPTLGCVSPTSTARRSGNSNVGTTNINNITTTLALPQTPSSPHAQNPPSPHAQNPPSPHAVVVTSGNNPVVCRSRPSIPSNARGIICATAIETPSHLVSGVKAEIEPLGPGQGLGKSRWKGSSTSPKPSQIIYEKKRGGTQVYEKLNSFYNMTTSTSQVGKRPTLTSKKMV